MSFEILHFRGAEKIIQEKKMKKEIQLTMLKSTEFLIYFMVQPRVHCRRLPS
jgi:hypothetical protein